MRKYDTMIEDKCSEVRKGNRREKSGRVCAARGLILTTGAKGHFSEGRKF